MFVHKIRPFKIFGVRYKHLYRFYKPRRFPWSPYLKEKVYRHPEPVEDESLPSEYPEIQDLSVVASHARLQQQYYDKFKELNTVEEKFIAVNLPKYYGWPSYQVKESHVPYDYLPFAQYVTRTVISEQKLLPARLTEEQIRPLLDQLKAELEKVFIFELRSKRLKLDLERKFMEEEKLPYFSPLDINVMKTKDLVKQLNSAITRVLVSQYPHLFSLQVDYDPRLEAFWRVGGFHLSKEDEALRKAKKIRNELKDLPIDRFLQYFGSPLLQLRSKLPLPVLPPLNWRVPADAENATPVDGQSSPKIESSSSSESSPTQESSSKESSVSKESSPSKESSAESETAQTVDEDRIYPLQSYRYRPDVYLQIPRKRLHGATMPGFWPNDPYRFGVLSYHSSNHIADRPTSFGEDEHKEALHAQALMASFAFTYGQACYQGFTTYNDITYPFASQSILTDGHRFSFYQYQLNTIVLHSDHNENTNPLFNVCYATPSQELYHSIENDRVTGWNDDVLTNLLSLYTNVPEVRESVDLCPYLNKDEKYAAHIEDKKKRVFIHDKHRFLVCHRSTDNREHDEEIYDWERIFKIEHQIRVTDARKRHFERFQDFLNDRKLDEHHPRYIPKHLREPGRSKRDKFEDTFYPDVFPDYHEIV